jgi:hypothetical protein
MSELSSELRPREFALLLLAGEAPPRARARDQQADRAGLSLKRHILETLLADDPEPEMMESSLMALVDSSTPPQGAARAVAVSILHEWKMMLDSPQWAAHLLDAAVQPTQQEPRRGRQLPG